MPIQQTQRVSRWKAFWHFGLDHVKHEHRDRIAIIALRVTAISATFSALALLANLINLAYVTKNLSLANKQSARADYQVVVQNHANLPRFSLLKKSPGQYRLRNVGTQPAWGISWAPIALGANGFPMDPKVVDLQATPSVEVHVLQPSALGSKDEATIFFPDARLDEYLVAGRAGILIQYETIEAQVVRAVFAMDKRGEYIIQTVAPN